MFQQFPEQMDLAIRNKHIQAEVLLPLLKETETKTYHDYRQSTTELVDCSARFPLETQVNHFPFSWHSAVICSLRH